MKNKFFGAIVLSLAAASLIGTTAFAQDETDIAMEISDNEKVYSGAFVPDYDTAEYDGLDGAFEKELAIKEGSAPAYDPNGGGHDYGERQESTFEWGRGNVDDLAGYWGNNVPDYICFANPFAKSYNVAEKRETTIYNVGIKDIDEAKKNAVLDILSGDCQVYFEDCKINYAERMKIADEIRAMNIADGDKVIADVAAKCVYIEMPDEEFEKVSPLLREKFPDVDVYTLTRTDPDYDGYSAESGAYATGVDTTGSVDVSAAAEKTLFEQPVFWAVVGGVVLMLGGTAAFMLRLRAEKKRVRATNAGTTVTDGNYSRKDVVRAVKNAESEPSAELFDRIMDKLDK